MNKNRIQDGIKRTAAVCLSLSIVGCMIFSAGLGKIYAVQDGEGGESGSSKKTEAAVEPEAAAKPETSAKPESSAESQTTAQPETSVKPENPSESGSPAQPETSVKPEGPAEPEASTKPETPAEPENSSGSETITQPESPSEQEPTVQPEDPSEPETTEPEDPSEPENVTEPETPSIQEIFEELEAPEVQEIFEELEASEGMDLFEGAEIQMLEEVELLAEEEAVYNGIEIDGNFDDWAAVSKADIDEGKGWETIDHAGIVWDGDYIYLYFAADGTDQGWAVTGNWNSVCGGGPHNNGQYAITTDLGNILLIGLKDKNGTPAVEGIDGALVAVNNRDWDKAPHYWEVAIPSECLPEYSETISFGFYQGETFFENVADLQGGQGGTFEGNIVIDGSYEDWKYYPHEMIQYATSGTHESMQDAKGALYSENGKLYAHASTNMPQHLQEAGGEFTDAVTIKINDNTDLEFGLRFITVDAAGNINWNPPQSGLPDGEYEYYIVSLDAPASSQNINDLTPGDEIYGKMIVTVGDTKDECEWEMDIAMLAKHLRPNVEGTVITEIDPSDVKTIAVQWGKLGQQWVETAGTSTGPLMGLLLCMGVAAAPALSNRKKREVQQ